MPEEDELPRLLSGRYRLEAVLGRGGMGVVYRATDLLMKRAVAVKLIRAADGSVIDDEIAGRFMREAKHTARLHHEHIIELFDLGRTNEGSLYFVMELLDGESLSARIRRERQLSPESTVHIGTQICAALQVAHASSVIHRDLKPANVMLVSRAGDDDFVKVLDFGVAKSMSGDQQTQLTHTGMLVGTLEYMAPEQIMGRPVDARTDIYALGIVLYRMLCGKPPFRDGGVPALVHAHLNTRPKPLSEMVNGVPAALDQVVLRCLAKAPEARFGSMAELARALTRAVPSLAGSFEVPNISDPDEEDVYESGDATVVGAFSRRAPTDGPASDALPADDATVDDGANAFDETTIRLGASGPPPGVRGSGSIPDLEGTEAQRRSTLPPVRVPRRPPIANAPLQDETLPLGRGEHGACAMCQTVNAPAARSCVACGVSLASEEQNAVRERVRTSPSGGPVAVAPAGDGLSMPIPSAPPIPWISEPPTQPRTIWDRFLSWTRWRNR